MTPSGVFLQSAKPQTLLHHIADPAAHLPRPRTKNAQAIPTSPFRSQRRRPIPQRDPAIRRKIPAGSRRSSAESANSRRPCRANRARSLHHRHIRSSRGHHMNRANINFLGSRPANQLRVGRLIDAGEKFRLPGARIHHQNIAAVGNLHARPSLKLALRQRKSPGIHQHRFLILSSEGRQATGLPRRRRRRSGSRMNAAKKKQRAPYQNYSERPPSAPPANLARLPGIVSVLSVSAIARSRRSR